MKNRIGFLDTKKRIFKIDLSYLSGDDLLLCVNCAAKELELKPRKICLLVDVSGSKLTVESLNYIKLSGKRIEQLIYKSAIVGVNKNKEPFYQVYLNYTGATMRSFPTEKLALSYLTSI